MFLVKTFIIFLLFVLSIESYDKYNKNQSRGKRRLPSNVEQYKWTTTTVKPDDVYIEPLGDIREYQNRYYIAVPLLYLADPDLPENDDQVITDLCIKMLEKYRFSDGEYVWRPYNSRFYGELRWKKKDSGLIDIGDDTSS